MFAIFIIGFSLNANGIIIIIILFLFFNFFLVVVVAGVFPIKYSLV